MVDSWERKPPGIKDGLEEESVTDRRTDGWMGGRTEPLIDLQGVKAVVGKDEKQMASRKRERDLSSRTGKDE